MNLIDVDSGFVVPFGKRDRKLSAFCGTPLVSNAFIDSMFAARNRLCDQVFKNLATEDEAIQVVDEQKGLKIAKKRLSISAPKTINLELPDPGSPGETFKVPVVFESDAKVSCAIHLTAEVMDFVCRAISTSEMGNRGKKRARDDRITTDYKEVLYNYSRGSFYVTYCDADGRKHTRHAKPDCDPRSTDEEQQQAIGECADRLHAFFMEQHHPEESQ